MDEPSLTGSSIDTLLPSTMAITFNLKGRFSDLIKVPTVEPSFISTSRGLKLFLINPMGSKKICKNQPPKIILYSASRS